MTTRLPPEPDQSPPQKKKDEAGKKYARMSKIGSGFYRENPVYCLCYNCLEILINDTVINTLLCPKCPSAQPLMNFGDFDRAEKEIFRIKIRKKLQEGTPPVDRDGGFQGSPG